MMFLIQMLFAAVTGQTVPRGDAVPPRPPVPVRRFPVAPPVPPAPPRPPAPPLDLPIVQMPSVQQRAEAAAGRRGLAKLGVRIDAAGRVTDCAPLSSAASGPTEVAGCKLAAMLRFRKPPRGAVSPLPIGVRFTGTSAEIVRAAAATPPEPIAATTSIQPSDYPPGALRASAEGRVEAYVLVSTQGTASDCVVVVPSGSIDLDDGTCRVALRLRYRPARDGFGDVEASGYRLKMSWQLPEDPPPALPPGK